MGNHIPRTKRMYVEMRVRYALFIPYYPLPFAYTNSADCTGVCTQDTLCGVQNSTTGVQRQMTKSTVYIILKPPL